MWSLPVYLLAFYILPNYRLAFCSDMSHTAFFSQIVCMVGGLMHPPPPCRYYFFLNIMQQFHFYSLNLLDSQTAVYPFASQGWVITEGNNN